jgi:hypothetical protein
MIDKMTMQKITLYREGFTSIVIRKVTLVDESYFYESLAYSHPNYLHERWAKIALSNEQVESQIEKYAQHRVQLTAFSVGTQSPTPLQMSLFEEESPAKSSGN